MAALALIVPVVFTVIFMRVLRRWLTEESNEIVPEEPVKPKAKVQGA
jgi:hypothetical protein